VADGAGFVDEEGGGPTIDVPAGGDGAVVAIPNGGPIELFGFDRGEGLGGLIVTKDADEGDVFVDQLLEGFFVFLGFGVSAAPENEADGAAAIMREVKRVAGESRGDEFGNFVADKKGIDFLESAPRLGGFVTRLLACG